MRIALWVFWLAFIATEHLRAAVADPEKEVPVIMLGYVDFREATIWVMDEYSDGCIEYREANKPGTTVQIKYAFMANVNAYFTLVFKAGPLDPGKTYQYRYYRPVSKTKGSGEFHTFKTPELWRWRKPAPDFRIALGSCHYINQREHDRPGPAYGDTSTDIFNRIADQQPDLMLWMGDNIYLREPDWGSEAGINERYIMHRKSGGIKKLLTACPNLSIWDDHDFGPNDANGSFYNKEKTLSAFRNFWPNPGCGISGMQGNAYAFDYLDVHFLMLDNRYNRTPDFCDSCPEESILGKTQLDWLKTSLLSLPKNEFKIICMGGQFLNSVKAFETYSRWEWERARITDFILSNKITNVVFLTGDRHFSELSMIRQEGKPSIYDFTVSPLTSRVFDKVAENNIYRVPGTFYNQNRSFGNVQFLYINKVRAIRFLLFDKEGKEIFRKEYTAETLP